MSKRKLRQLVETGRVSGWDDPRMPTLCGLRRRGYTAKAVRDFCERIGVAKVTSTIEYAFLEHCLREDLNETAQRTMEFGVMLLHSENKNNDPDLDKKCKAFLDEIGREMGASLAFFDEAAFLRQGFPCFFIGSGGSESWFLSVYSKLKGPYYLLTTDNQNSLAASMKP